MYNETYFHHSHCPLFSLNVITHMQTFHLLFHCPSSNLRALFTFRFKFPLSCHTLNPFYFSSSCIYTLTPLQPFSGH